MDKKTGLILNGLALIAEYIVVVFITGVVTLNDVLAVGGRCLDVNATMCI